MGESLTIATTPDTASTAAAMLAFMAGQSGVLTDYNEGSQIRTQAEAFGQIAEIQGIAAEALAFQVIIYGSWAAFGIEPLGASSSVGTVTFTTAAPGAVTFPPTSQAVYIPLGTYVGTTGGAIYQTSVATTIPLNATGISVPVIAVTSGSVGNTPAGTITTILSGLPYPLFVSNPSALTSGTDAETPDQTMTRFTAKALSLATGTPVSIPNACIGIAGAPGETVRYAVCDEPWLRAATPAQQEAGFTVYVDNGSGVASAALLAAVTTFLNGAIALQQNGNRPAGVPFSVQAVTPVPWSLQVTATLLDPTTEAACAALVQTAATAYAASLYFGDDIVFGAINASIANTLAGYTSSLTVQLLDGSGNSQTVIAVPSYERAQLTAVTFV